REPRKLEVETCPELGSAVERPVVLLIDELRRAGRAPDRRGDLRRGVLLDEGERAAAGRKVLRVPIEDLRAFDPSLGFADRLRASGHDEGAWRSQERPNAPVELSVERRAPVRLRGDRRARLR